MEEAKNRITIVTQEEETPSNELGDEFSGSGSEDDEESNNEDPYGSGSDSDNDSGSGTQPKVVCKDNGKGMTWDVGVALYGIDELYMLTSCRSQGTLLPLRNPVEHLTGTTS